MVTKEHSFEFDTSIAFSVAEKALSARGDFVVAQRMKDQAIFAVGSKDIDFVVLGLGAGIGIIFLFFFLLLAVIIFAAVVGYVATLHNNSLHIVFDGKMQEAVRWTSLQLEERAENSLMN